MNASQLRALVAPIALYPDPLVAQVLSAATFPHQVAVANYWVQQHKELTGQSLMHAVDSQAWNASIKALTEFPSVLDNMAKNLNWTSALGEAYHNQSSEVMAAIQTLRAQAKTQGSLKSGPQMTITQSSPAALCNARLHARRGCCGNVARFWYGRRCRRSGWRRVLRMGMGSVELQLGRRGRCL